MDQRLPVAVGDRCQEATLAGDTVASLAARMAFDDAKEARFRVLNGLASGDRVSVGDKVKIVVRASS